MTRTNSLRTFWLASLALSVLVGCVSTARRMPAVDELVRRNPEADSELLQVGRTLVITECTACHRQYWPSEYGPLAWNRISRNMGRRASMGPDQAKAVGTYMSLSAQAVAEPEPVEAETPRED